jgi:DME family drug/metabolite transporter
LLYLAPALVLAGAGPLLGEPPTRRQVGLAALSVAGVWLVVSGAREAELALTPRGVAWGLAAAASYAIYTLLGRYASPRWGSVATVLHATWGACVLLLVAIPLAWGAPRMPAGGTAWTLLIVYGVLTIAVAALLFYDALARVPAGSVTILLTAEPVVAALLATVLVNQGLTGRGWLGLALVVIGVAGTARRRSPVRSGPAASGPG